jgi:hypothetical protein
MAMKSGFLAASTTMKGGFIGISCAGDSEIAAPWGDSEIAAPCGDSEIAAPCGDSEIAAP